MWDQSVRPNDGRALEQAVARYFAANGYETSCNQVIEGRSGAPHEIDVLAVRPDPLARVKVAIECKSWRSPIEKAVLSKLDYVMRDCGLNKGIVVSTGGFRSGAERAAAELGIDLWGPDQVSHLLGPALTQMAVSTAPTVREGLGWPFLTDAATADRVIRAESRGSALLGRQETVRWKGPVWFPVHALWLSLAVPQRKRGRMTTVSQQIAYRYDGLSGTLIGQIPQTPESIDLGQVPTIPAMTSPRQVASTLSKALDAAWKVKTDAAKARHAANLATLGVPWPIQGFSTDHLEATWWPLWLALVEGRAGQRVIAVDGTTGSLDGTLSSVATAGLMYVRPALGW